MADRRIVLLFVFSALSFPFAAVALPQGGSGQILHRQTLPGGDVVTTVRTGPGQRVRGPMYDTPPPPPSEALEEELESDAQLPTPIREDRLYIAPAQSMETDPDNLARPEVPGTAIIYRNSVLAPPSGLSSNVNEPSVGSQADGLFTTHNWYAAVSTNNGASFSYVSPFTTFPSSPSAFGAGFCCDQRVAQDTSRDLVFWYLQYIKTGSTSTSTNGVRIAVAHGQADLASNTWVYYNLTPSLLGLGSGRWIDFPHMQVSANYLYFTTNVFTTSGDTFAGSLVGRISLAELDAGGSVTINSYFTSAFGSIMAVNGAGAEGTRPGRTTMYFAALYSTTSIRVLVWPEASSAPTVNTVSGLSTTSLSTYVCTGPDSLDPCTRANARMQTGWITDTELGVMWTSSQNSGGGRPYPYTKVAILNPSTLAVVSQPEVWNNSYAWLYPAVAINERGHLGGTIDALGGTFYPTVHGLIRDDLSPDVFTNGWEVVGVATSTHGTSGRWGDYNGAAVHELYPRTWLGGGHTQNGGSDNASARPRNFWLMRERDIPGAAGLDFYTVVPCRVIDTRPSSTLSSGVPLVIDVSGICGVPSDAKAVSINVTAINATNSGNLRLYPGDSSVPTTSALNFQAGVSRANNSIMLLATNGDGTLGAAAFLNGGGAVDVLVDVNGYYK
jgi:hypothetical protein